MLGEFAVATTSLVIIKPLRCWCVNLLHLNRGLFVNFMLIAPLFVECTKRARIFMYLLSRGEIIESFAFSKRYVYIYRVGWQGRVSYRGER